MDALDFGCIKGPYSSRGQLLKGSTPQGQKVSRSVGFVSAIGYLFVIGYLFAIVGYLFALFSFQE
jgi:hypothetical protein